MPAALPLELRRRIVESHQQGKTLREMSLTLGLAYVTVKGIWAHWVKYGKLTPNYEQARQKGTRKYEVMYAESLEIKKAHPTWGGEMIRLELSKRLPDTLLPSVRSLQRWFRQAGINRGHKAEHRGGNSVKRGQNVHEVWAVDAKEKIRLQSGEQASWLVISDEASGAILRATSFPPGDMGTSAADPGTREFEADFRVVGIAPTHAL
jgi:hypothetical protein